MKNLKNIKVIFIDIDGTLTNDKNEITEYTKSVIKKAVSKGIYIIICSGRTNGYVVEKSRECNASNIVISSNGAMIFDYLNNKKIFESNFNMNILEKILNYAIKFKVEATFNSTYKRYRTKMREKDYNKNIVKVNKVTDIDDIVSQIVLDSNEYKNIKDFQYFIETLNEVEICNVSENLQQNKININDDYWMDLVVRGNSKGNAIRKVLQILNIEKEDTICFGDQENDTPMFEAVGIKVAMENAVDNLKKKADFVTFSNNENGVAKFIEENIL